MTQMTILETRQIDIETKNIPRLGRGWKTK